MGKWNSSYLSCEDKRLIRRLHGYETPEKIATRIYRKSATIREYINRVIRKVKPQRDDTSSMFDPNIGTIPF